MATAFSRPGDGCAARRRAAPRRARPRAHRAAPRRPAHNARRACRAPRCRPRRRAAAATPATRLDLLGRDAARAQQPHASALDLDDGRFQRRPASGRHRRSAGCVSPRSACHGCGGRGADPARRIGAGRGERPAEARRSARRQSPCGMRSATVSSPAVTSGWIAAPWLQRQHQRQRARPECLGELARQRVEDRDRSAIASATTWAISGLKRGRPLASKMRATACRWWRRRPAHRRSRSGSPRPRRPRAAASARAFASPLSTISATSRFRVSSRRAYSAAARARQVTPRHHFLITKMLAFAASRRKARRRLDRSFAWGLREVSCALRQRFLWSGRCGPAEPRLRRSSCCRPMTGNALDAVDDRARPRPTLHLPPAGDRCPNPRSRPIAASRARSTSISPSIIALGRTCRRRRKRRGDRPKTKRLAGRIAHADGHPRRHGRRCIRRKRRPARRPTVPAAPASRDPGACTGERRRSSAGAGTPASRSRAPGDHRCSRRARAAASPTAATPCHESQCCGRAAVTSSISHNDRNNRGWL